MASTFEELDFQHTDLGELVLRRRRPIGDPATWIYEVKLDGRFLMSSLVSDSERELARRGLRRVDGSSLRVLVGGLGLGWTAAEALSDPRVRRLDVVERLPAVVSWHERRLVPLAGALGDDARCHLVLDDCFALLQREPTAVYDAILLDIDDSPQDLLDDAHGAFYTADGLARARRWLRKGGVFGLWTNVAADERLRARLAAAFDGAEVDAVAFTNPLLGEDEVNALYFARA